MAGSRQQGSRRVSTLGGLAMLAIPGFALGALAGIVWEDPGLVAAYLFGATEEVAWSGSSTDAGAKTPPPVAVNSPVTATAPNPKKTASAKPTARPAPKSKPRVSPPIRNIASGNVAIQVGAFSERAAAQRLAKDLRGKGFPVLIVPGDGSGTPRYRVRVGPLGSRDEAEQTAAQLKRDEKLPTWIVEDDG
jgi:cell division septation protein DedD